MGYFWSELISSTPNQRAWVFLAGPCLDDSERATVIATEEESKLTVSYRTLTGTPLSVDAERTIRELAGMTNIAFDRVVNRQTGTVLFFER